MPLRILHIAPLIEPLGPRAPGGAEVGVILLASEQQRLGHKISIIATQGSLVPQGMELVDLGVKPGVLRPVPTHAAPLSYHPDTDTLRREEVVFNDVFAFVEHNRSAFDLIHNHACDVICFEKLHRFGLPVVHTLQVPPLFAALPKALCACASSGNVVLVCLSKASAVQYALLTGTRPVTVYYGLDPVDVPFRAEAGEGWIWAARISPEKGLQQAIDLTVRERRERLTICGRIYDERFYRKVLAPVAAHPLVRCLGHIPRPRLFEELSRAKALLMPVTWEEPFGFAALESLACGTPVIASGLGALPEIVEHGRNGFICNSREEFRSALQRIPEIDRSLCRTTVESKFSRKTMAAGYERIYKELLAERSAAGALEKALS